MRRYLLKLALVAALGVLVAWAVGCEKKPELIYETHFDTTTLGPEWKNEGGDWIVEDGVLKSRKAVNKDLVLTTPLPAEGVIELRMISHSPQVDIKFRAWGDLSADLHDGAYHFILGGWGNKISTIAPLGEHDTRRVTREAGLKPDTWYTVKVVRKNGRITMYLDGEEYLSYADKDPLSADTYKYFSFANWKSDCAFDDLKIYGYK
jgi:hypothetical protein